jgi:hypothetical protein
LNVGKYGRCEIRIHSYSDEISRFMVVFPSITHVCPSEYEYIPQKPVLVAKATITTGEPDRRLVFTVETFNDSV